MIGLICFVACIFNLGLGFICGRGWGPESDYIEFDEVLRILEERRSQHHYASRYSLDIRDEIGKCIKDVKLYHIHQFPSKYMEKKEVFNEEAKNYCKKKRN